MKNTKLICTIGPASQSKEILTQLVKAGMNAARLNFSHGTYDSFIEMISNIREISQKLETPVAIIQDLQGPKIRLGILPEEGVQVVKNQEIILDTTIKSFQELRSNTDTENTVPLHIPLRYKALPKDIKQSDPVLIDDGKIELQVNSVQADQTQIVCTVKNNGTLYSHKGLNAPKTKLSVEAISKKDAEDLQFGLKHDVDYIALSFVRTADDIKQLKDIIKKAGKEIKVISKIERPEAMENLEEIVTESDAIMVARGDLGIEIPAELVPIAQKRIIQEANKQGKPVITATHVLNSMVDNPLPTRAEISDAANAIFDNTDCIMLSNETAVGLYPVQACETLTHVAVAIEAEIKKHQLQKQHPPLDKTSARLAIDALSHNAVHLAKDINAKYIIALSRQGFTATQISKNRSETESIIFTSSQKTKNQLAIVWGIHNVFVDPNLNYESPIQTVKDQLLEVKLVKPKDRLVIVNATQDTEDHIISTCQI